MSTERSVPSPPGTPPGVGLPGLVAAAIIGVHALGCAVLAVFFPLVAAQGATLSNLSHVMFSVFTFLFAVGLGLVAKGLFTGLSWPRTAAVVWLLLLMPVGWAMFQAGWGLVGSLILGSASAGIAAVALETRNTP